MGLLCAFGWWTFGLNIDTLLLISTGLVLRSVVKNICIDGNPKNICRRFNRESHPCRKTRAPERDGKATIDWIVSSKECFDYFGYFDAPVGLNESNHFALSLGVMLDVFGSGAEACVSSQHLDIPQATANFADPSRCTGHERPPAAMRGAADHPEPGIKAMKPHGDRAR